METMCVRDGVQVMVITCDACGAAEMVEVPAGAHGVPRQAGWSHGYFRLNEQVLRKDGEGLLVYFEKHREVTFTVCPSCHELRVTGLNERFPEPPPKPKRVLWFDPVNPPDDKYAACEVHWARDKEHGLAIAGRFGGEFDVVDIGSYVGSGEDHGFFLNFVWFHTKTQAEFRHHGNTAELIESDFEWFNKWRAGQKKV